MTETASPRPPDAGTPSRPRRPASFWGALDQLLAGGELVIDRPRGSTHPRHRDIVYPLDYGYLAGTAAGDGREVDVWRGSRAAAELDAAVCTVDLMKRDVEIKLLLGCTEPEKQTVMDFHSGTHAGVALVRRPGSRRSP